MNTIQLIQYTKQRITRAQADLTPEGLAKTYESSRVNKYSFYKGKTIEQIKAIQEEEIESLKARLMKLEAVEGLDLALQQKMGPEFVCEMGSDDGQIVCTNERNPKYNLRKFSVTRNGNDYEVDVEITRWARSPLMVGPTGQKCQAIRANINQKFVTQDNIAAKVIKLVQDVNDSGSTADVTLDGDPFCSEGG